MIGDTLTLCNVKFESINTLNGDVTYKVTPKGVEEGISARVESGVTIFDKSKAMTNVIAYNSVADYEHDVRIEEEFSLENFLNGLHSVRNLPASLVKLGNEDKYAFKSYKFANGDIEEVCTYFPIIYGKSGKIDNNFKSVYKTREEALAWNDIKVSENGTETIKEGVLKALSLTDEQKALVEEFMKMKDKLNENNIKIIYDNDECVMSFVNTSKYDLDCAYSKEEIHDKDTEGYEEISYLLEGSLKNICSKNPTYDIYDFYDGKYFVRKK
jgi:hypothetical protein